MSDISQLDSGDAQTQVLMVSELVIRQTPFSCRRFSLSERLRCTDLRVKVSHSGGLYVLLSQYFHFDWS